MALVSLRASWQFSPSEVAVSSTNRPVGRVAPVRIQAPPGRHGDGPVHSRVDNALAGLWRAPSDYEVELNDWRCSWDPQFDYVEIENSRLAFAYLTEMIDRGVPPAALSVVRLAGPEAYR